MSQKCPMWDSIFGVPMSSEQTAAVIDRCDLGKFQADKIFTPDNARSLAALATVAYSDPKDQKLHLDKQTGLKSVRFLDSENNEELGIDYPDTGTQVTVVETEGAVLVAARGTSPPWLANLGKENEAQWQDYLADLAALPVPNYNDSAKVHGGFKVAADGIWGQLKPILKSARAANKAVHFAGHSLGAAIALHLADRAQVDLGVLAKSVVRTGGPDVGWDDQKAHLEKNGLAARTFNFVNNTDPIPLALPKGEVAGHEIYINRHGEAKLEGGCHPWNRLVGTVTGLSHGNIDPLYDHVPVFYNDKLHDPKNQKVLEELQAQVEGL